MFGPPFHFRFTRIESNTTFINCYNHEESHLLSEPFLPYHEQRLAQEHVSFHFQTQVSTS